MQILEQKIITEEKNLMMIYDLVMPMFELWNENVIDPWMQVFGKLIVILPFKKLEKDLNNLIVSYCSELTPPIHRYIAARIIGFVAQVSLRLFWIG